MASASRSRQGSSRKALAGTFAAVAVVGAAAAAWRFTPLAEYVDPVALYERTKELLQTPWAPLWAVAGFVAAGFLVVPVNLLFVVMGLAFDFWTAAVVSMVGALASMLSVYLVGRKARLDRLLERAPRPVRALGERGLRNASVIELSALRFLPLGPFTMMNLLWGAARVPVRRALVASVIGLVPGVTIASLLGEGLGMTLQDLNARNLGLVAMASLGLLALAWAGKRMLRGRLAPSEES